MIDANAEQAALVLRGECFESQGGIDDSQIACDIEVWCDHRTRPRVADLYLPGISIVGENTHCTAQAVHEREEMP